MAPNQFKPKPTAYMPLRQLPADCHLVHATNCIATWGAGIAAELATIFPAACTVYKRYCNAKTDASLPRRYLAAGTCLIIPPQKADIDAGAPRVSIVCLFTSTGYGKANIAAGKPGRDSPETILAQTKSSLKDYRAQLDELKTPPDVYSPQFNSGAFRLPWEKTASVITDEFAGWQGRWLVLAPPP